MGGMIVTLVCTHKTSCVCLRSRIVVPDLASSVSRCVPDLSSPSKPEGMACAHFPVPPTKRNEDNAEHRPGTASPGRREGRSAASFGSQRTARSRFCGTSTHVTAIDAPNLDDVDRVVRPGGAQVDLCKTAWSRARNRATVLDVRINRLRRVLSRTAHRALTFESEPGTCS